MLNNRWFLNTKNNAWFVIDEVGRRIAKIVKQPDAEDNASIIAAAPELLDALKAAVDCGMVPNSSASDGGAAGYSRQVIVADIIRAAIAKATDGKQ